MMAPTRWFDENGNEIIRQAYDPDQREHVAEIGGNLDVSGVGLNVYGEVFDKEEVSSLLAASPSKAWNPGEKHSIGNGKKSRITDWGKWYMSGPKDEREVEAKIIELLNQLSQDLDNWKLLTNKYEVWIDVAGYMKSWNRGFRLSPAIMSMLAERNLEIVFDMYFDGSEDE